MPLELNHKNINKNIHGFTLIELSIVIVIIGLVVGGIIVGNDLISSTELRATISQAEQYSTASNTFRLKYNNFLPGDIPDPYANQFGLAARGTLAGQGDGNGILEGYNGTPPIVNFGWVQSAGETAMFWVDLSSSGLISGNFNTAKSDLVPGSPISSSNMGLYFPPARIGKANYFYAYSPWSAFGLPSTNYIGTSAPLTIDSANSCAWCMTSNPNIKVNQADTIDKKIDDGVANKGKVIAMYANSIAFGDQGTGWSVNAATDSAATCFNSASGKYSVGNNKGEGLNCGISFQLQ